MDTTKAAIIWRFEDAPEEFKILSDHGGDEDWVVFVPDSMQDEWMPWLDRIGVSSVSEHEVDGGTVHIGAHA